MMSALAFDSLRFARRLKQVGVPEQQAEAQAELMAETFGYYVDNLVTKDYLDARLDASFAEQDARIDARFAEQDAHIDRLFAEQKSLFESRFAKQDLKIEKLQSAMDAKFNVMAATLALIAASVVPGAISNLLSG